MIIAHRITRSNSTVLGYSRVQWIRRWWEADAKWNEAVQTRWRGETWIETMPSQPACLHVPCRFPDGTDDGAVYRVRSRVRVGDRVSGREVMRIWAEARGWAWWWVMEVSDG